MKIGFSSTPRLYQLEFPLLEVMEPPFRKLGEAVKARPVFDPPIWPEFVLGGPCEGHAANPYRCTGESEVDTGDGLYCRVCYCTREGWM
ncbi:hypothetical protein SAMN04488103_102439 [Gemmobacter aquatilis]|uniref:Uncharacterized protein n=1 Tax=Gemmobacter aquatilis TaxID=933059 RepID=A0A1H8CBK6_9RHOB|nr:hypothetical protein SAMN04488103_102439 [Gemmobacter aquatilis]